MKKQRSVVLTDGDDDFFCLGKFGQGNAFSIVFYIYFYVYLITNLDGEEQFIRKQAAFFLSFGDNHSHLRQTGNRKSAREIAP